MADEKQFVASPEAKAKAKQLRLFAALAWLVAIGGEVFAILKLFGNEMLVWLIVALVVIMGLSILGSVLWKKANRMDPASEKDKFRFFVQNQLGAIMAVLAFLPLIILLLTNKDVDKKTKGIAGTVAVVAMLIAGISGVDLDPPSIERYTEQINAQTTELEELTNGVNHVYWTRAGNKYHIFSDCYHIKNRDQFEGTVKDFWIDRKKDDPELCLTCKGRIERGEEIQLPDEVRDALE